MSRRALCAVLVASSCSSGNAERTRASEATAAAPPPAVAPVAAPAPAPAPAAVEPMGDEEASQLYATACTSCHTAGFVEGSRISEKGWNAEIAKMRKWGALVDEDRAPAFAAWLARRYPAAEVEPPAPVMSAAAAAASVAGDSSERSQGDRARGRQLYAQACASCHGAAALGSGGGPALVENPALHQRDRFTRLVRGGQGRMPGFEDLKAEDVAGLIAFLRDLPSR